MKNARNTLQYRLLRFLVRLISHIPTKQLYAFANLAAAVVWRLAPARRKVAVDAMQKHLRLSREEAQRLARRSFTENIFSFLQIFHVGDFFLDSCVSRVMPPERHAQIVSETVPIVIATAHIGSWELMPGLASDIVPERHGMVVVRSRKNSALNALMADLRGARGMQAIDHRQATDVVMPHLRKNGVAGFLVDHNAGRRESIFLPFLEDIAAVNVGPAMLALRSKAVVYPVFLIRDYSKKGSDYTEEYSESSGDSSGRGEAAGAGRAGPLEGAPACGPTHQGKHILYFYPPLHTADLKGPIAERIAVVTKFYTDAVADIIKKHPEQWFWMHKRWKTRPPGKKEEVSAEVVEAGVSGKETDV